MHFQKTKLQTVINLLFIIFLTAHINTMFSQWSTDPAINTRVADAGLNLEMISDGNGGAFIVYENTPALLRQLWVQRLDKHGYVKFPENGIRVSGENITQFPGCLLTSDQNGGVFITFNKFILGDEQNYSAVYVQRIDSSGTKLWGDVGIEIAPEQANAGFAALCSDGEGGVIIFWTQNVRHLGQDVYDLIAQRIDSEGNLLWGNVGIILCDHVRLGGVIPVLTSQNTFYIAYVSYSEADAQESKILQLNKQGQFIWSNEVDPYYEKQSTFNIVNDNTGGIIIGGRKITLSEIGLKAFIISQRIDKDGNRLWGNNGKIISENANYSNTKQIEIVKDQQGNYIFFWQNSIFNVTNIYAQRLNNDGEIVWGDQDIIIGDPNINKYFYNIGIADDGNLKPVIVWKNNDTEPGLYATLLNSNGTQVWQKMITNDKKETDKNSIKVISDQNGGAIIGWYEISDRWGTYAQQINKNGDLGTVLPTKITENKELNVPSICQLSPGYPNPFYLSTTINYSVEKDGPVQIAIYDLLGRRVQTLVDERRSAGSYRAVWNGCDTSGCSVASGIYFVRMQVGGKAQSFKISYVK